MLEIVDDIFCYVLQYEIITYLCTMTEKKNLSIIHIFYVGLLNPFEANVPFLYP